MSGSRSIIGEQITTISNASTKGNSLSPSKARNLVNFIVIWLDSSINYSNKDTRNAITELRCIIHSITTFTDTNACIDFLTDVEDEKVFMILSSSLSQELIPLIENIAQLHSIYLFRTDESPNEQWLKKCRKVSGVFSQIEHICDVIRRAIDRSEADLTPISFVSMSPSTKLDELDQSFMYSQLLKELILEINHRGKAKDEFVDFLSIHYADIDVMLNQINNFQQRYELHTPIWWYTKESFIYSVLNKALRIQDIEAILKMGFFLRDLHRQIERHHNEAHQTTRMTVFRGQGLSDFDFEKLKKNLGGLISFNSFLSTSTAEDVSLAFAESSGQDPDLIGIFFRMEIDPKVSSVPFAFLKNISQFSDSEQEYLFSMNTVFRIDKIQQIKDRLWQVSLTLTKDNDQQLKRLTDYIRHELGSGPGWHRMGILMQKMGNFEKVVEIYDNLLETMSISIDNQTEVFTSMASIYNNIAFAHFSKGNYSNALSYYEQTLKIDEKLFPSNHPQRATAYNNIGMAYQAMGDYTTSLSYHEKALQIHQKFPSANRAELAVTYSNIGVVHQSLGNYSSALSYYEKTIEIQKKCLPSNHPNLATTYNNAAAVHQSMGNASAAASYFEKTLKIMEKSLPSDHPDLATHYSNIGMMHHSMGDSSTALSYYQKVLEIEHKSLPPHHPSLPITYNNLGNMHRTMGNYSDALLCFEKALEIKKKSVPSDHPDIAAIYSNVGLMHQLMGNYSSALLNYQKTLEIQRKSLPLPHPSLFITYSNIAALQVAMGNYSDALSYLARTPDVQSESSPSYPGDLANKYVTTGMAHYLKGDYTTALSYLEKALELQHKSLSSDHPSLSVTFISLGMIYQAMRNYSNALSYYEKSLKLMNKSFSSNHPSIATIYNNIGLVHNSTGNYSAALSHLEKGLEIQQKSLSHNHPHMGTIYNNIAAVHRSMKNYTNALSYLEKTLEIQQKSLSPDHPDCASTCINMAVIHADLYQYEKAVKYAERAVKITRHVFGPEHLKTIEIQKLHDQLQDQLGEGR